MTRNKSIHGLAVVEMAIVLPILMLLTLAAGEFGRKPDRQSALSTFAQVLLQSNEFNFAD